MRKAIVISLITLALAASTGVHANTANATLSPSLNATKVVLMAGSNAGTALSQTAAIAMPSGVMMATDTDLMQWSNLPTIVLGLIGLIWVRRHVAQL